MNKVAKRITEGQTTLNSFKKGIALPKSEKIFKLVLELQFMAMSK